MTKYSSIPSIESGENNGGGGGDEREQAHAASRHHHHLSRQQRRKQKFVLLFLGSIMAISLVTLAVFASMRSTSTLTLAERYYEGKTANSVLPMPHGVNLGSWLSLEDYFYVGRHGAIEVATPDNISAAICLPPLHLGGDGHRWNSETDLFANLTQTRGVKHAIQVFHAFRVSYLDWDKELSQMAQLGVQHVRVPMSWCLTNHDPSNDEDLDSIAEENDDILLKHYTCKDPFFEDRGVDVVWPAVPRSFLTRFLRACQRHGIKASLDIHTYPGGTSLGTFSGVWPRKPLFWKYDNPGNPDMDVGRQMLRDFVSWVESLSESDPEAFAGLGAISPMNEPAHLAGLFGPGSAAESFLPSLPSHIADEFLAELDKADNNGGLSYTSVPDGPHLRVLLWLRDAIEIFRSSSLPQLGVELHVNVHESIFVSLLVPDDASDDGGRHPYATAILATWWRSTTRAAERSSWAVLDMHHYHAWEPFCQGAVDGSGNYTCGDANGTDLTLGRCSSWATMYRSVMDAHLGKGARLNSAEFSASTHHSVLKSCLDTTTLRKTYLAQVEAADKANVALYWWSWKMPYGGAFRDAWSFKHLLYLLGVLSRPDESDLECVA